VLAAVVPAVEPDDAVPADVVPDATTLPDAAVTAGADVADVAAVVGALVAEPLAVVCAADGVFVALLLPQAASSIGIMSERSANDAARPEILRFHVRPLDIVSSRDSEPQTYKRR
jgi:hypothetical protein